MTLAIEIETPFDKSFEVHVSNRAIVLDIKKKIKEEHGTPVERQGLFFKGAELENSIPILCYGVVDHSRILLLDMFSQPCRTPNISPPHYTSPTIMVMVKPLDGEKVAVEINPFGNVSELRAEVEKLKAGMTIEVPEPHYVFSHNLRPMNDDATFQSYWVNNGDTVDILPGGSDYAPLPGSSTC